MSSVILKYVLSQTKNNFLWIQNIHNFCGFHELQEFTTTWTFNWKKSIIPIYSRFQICNFRKLKIDFCSNSLFHNIFDFFFKSIEVTFCVAYMSRYGSRALGMIFVNLVASKFQTIWFFPFTAFLEYFLECKTVLKL